MDPNTRLRVATRIHFSLLRHLGDSVEVQDILHRPTHTREVLWVCDASGDDELVALAAQFRHASRPDAPVPDTPVPPPSPSPATDTDWFRPSTWLRNR